MQGMLLAVVVVGTPCIITLSARPIGIAIFISTQKAKGMMVLGNACQGGEIIRSS